MPAIVVASLVGAAASVGTGAIASRSQSNAAKRAQGAQQQADDKAMQWEREQEAYRRAEAERVAEEDKRRFEIEEQNRVQQAQIQEADRQRQMEADMWNRARSERLDAMSAEDRRLQMQREAEKEARLAPYREASRAALGRLQGIVGAPGAGTSPAAHQFSQPTTFQALLPKG